MAKTVADLLVERLIDWGVEAIFGLPGDGVNGIFEALRTHGEKIRFIQVRHEEAAAFAACGYAKYTGRLGVCVAMANGLPYSIGAAVAYPDRQVVCVVGDGGMTMLMGEVATLVKYNLNVKVIVIKNNLLGEIKWEQMVLEGNPEFGVELQPIDFAGFAMNCGAAGFTIERPEEAESVLRQALAHPGPAVVQAVVDPNEPPMPGKVSTEQAVKFGEALVKGQKEGWKIIKTVMEDKVREVV
jgi:pyruvate dehydrogenase (quinone)